MLLLILTAVLSGIWLGLRHRVLILAPVTLVFFIAILGFGIASGDRPWSIFLWMMFTGIALQIGFCGGSYFVATRQSKASSAAASVQRSAPKPT